MKNSFLLLTTVSLIIILHSCSGEIPKRTADEKKPKAPETGDAISDSLMINPFYADDFFAGAAYSPLYFNEKYIRFRKIKSITQEFWEEKNGKWIEFGQWNQYEFNTKGQLVKYYQWNNWSDGIDTTLYASFEYEDGKLMAKYIGETWPPSKNYGYGYNYDEPGVVKETEFEEKSEISAVFYVHDENGQAECIQKYSRGKLNSVTAFTYEAPDDELRKEIAGHYTPYFEDPGDAFIMLLEMKNGQPHHCELLNKDGSLDSMEERWWKYSKEGKLLEYSYRAIGGHNVSDSFEYGVNGLPDKAWWKRKDDMVKLFYTFY